MSSIWKHIALGVGALGATAVSAVVGAKAADKASDYREKQRRERLDEELDLLRKKVNPITTNTLESKPVSEISTTEIYQQSARSAIEKHMEKINNDFSGFYSSSVDSNDDDLQCKVFEKRESKDGQA